MSSLCRWAARVSAASAATGPHPARARSTSTRATTCWVTPLRAGGAGFAGVGRVVADGVRAGPATAVTVARGALVVGAGSAVIAADVVVVVGVVVVDVVGVRPGSLPSSP